MKKLLFILSFLICAYVSNAQVPQPPFSPNATTSKYKVGYLIADSALISNPRDTSWNPALKGSMSYWQHSGADSSLWIFSGATSGSRWQKVVTLPAGSGGGLVIAVSGNSPIYVTGTATNPIINVDTGRGVAQIPTGGDLKKAIDSLAAANPWTRTGTNIYPTTLTDFVGIGTNSPQVQLHTASSAADNTFIIENSNPAGFSAFAGWGSSGVGFAKTKWAFGYGNPSATSYPNLNYWITENLLGVYTSVPDMIRGASFNSGAAYTNRIFERISMATGFNSWYDSSGVAVLTFNRQGGNLDILGTLTARATSTAASTGSLLQISAGGLVTKISPSGGTGTLISISPNANYGLTSSDNGSTTAFSFTINGAHPTPIDVTASGYLQGSTLVLGALTQQAYKQGMLQYDTDNESLTFDNNDANVSLQIGQEEWIRVKNVTGSSIANGAAVYLSGSNAGMPTIALAQANASSTTLGIGLATETIANNAIGYVTVFGVVHGLNTAAFTAGQVVFISSSVAGGLTSTAPTAPNYRYRLGIVAVADAVTGTIHVTPSTASLGNGTADQLFGMNNAGTAQEVKSIVAGANVSVTNTANTITISATPGAVSSVTGTTGQVTVAPNTGAIIVGLPSALTIPGTVTMAAAFTNTGTTGLGQLTANTTTVTGLLTATNVTTGNFTATGTTGLSTLNAATSTFTGLLTTPFAAFGRFSATAASNTTGLTNVGVINTTSLVATNITGALLTVAQPNVTSLGTQSNVTVTGKVNAGSVSATTITATSLTLTNLSVINNTTIGGTLAVTGTGNIAGNLGVVSNSLGNKLNVGTITSYTGNDFVIGGSGQDFAISRASNQANLFSTNNFAFKPSGVGALGNIGVNQDAGVYRLGITGAVVINGRQYLAEYEASVGLSTLFDCFRFLDNQASAAVIGLNKVSGILELTFSDLGTGANQSQYTYSVHSYGNGATGATLTLISTGTRGTNPITGTITIVNDGGSGGIKIQATSIGATITGVLSTCTFSGIAY